jgi:hypothetical protein
MRAAARSGRCVAIAVTALTLVAAAVGCGRGRDAPAGERHAGQAPGELNGPVEPTRADLRGGPGGGGARPVIDRAGFWAIIDGVRREAPDDEVFLERLTARLRALSPGELVSLQRELHAVHDESYGWPLWGACYLINGGCGDAWDFDDSFEMLKRYPKLYARFGR